MARRKGRLKWLVGGMLVVAGAITAFFVYYHPPMRLMPAPLMFQAGAVPLTELEPALAEGSRIEVFYASSRLPVGPADARVYTVVPDNRLHLGRAEMRIGEDGTTLAQIYEWTTGAGRDDRPFVHLERMRQYATVAPADAPDDPATEGLDADAARWIDEINRNLALSRHRNILVYVHGANTTVERGAGQAAMLRHFTGRNAVVVVFIWPTAENFLRYSQDIQNAYGASPRLVELIALLARHSDAEKIDVFTYSAGGTVGSDALGRLPAAAPDAALRLGEVIHAAPDADQARFIDDV
ncbi:MAG: alpha/beta hydrolase, partial [Rubellimicrobium sp.]|nr:alpha/beta hydrolase [Rubellimicrobium sp.]